MFSSFHGGQGVGGDRASPAVLRDREHTAAVSGWAQTGMHTRQRHVHVQPVCYLLMDFDFKGVASL